MDIKTGKTWAFLTNNFALPATTIYARYKCRWQVELFFKPVLSKVEGWIRQHLRIKKFYGNSENAVKSQIWIAISIYVIVAIVKKTQSGRLSLHLVTDIVPVGRPTFVAAMSKQRFKKL